MNAYYALTTKLYDLLLADEDIHTVTKGGIIDLDKKNVFGLAHINVVSAIPSTSTITFSVSIIAADLRNISNVQSTEKFIGHDNEDDNLNSMMYVLIRLYLELHKQEEDYDILTPPTLTPFIEDHGNITDGWHAVFEIEAPIGDVSSC